MTFPFDSHLPANLQSQIEELRQQVGELRGENKVLRESLEYERSRSHYPYPFQYPNTLPNPTVYPTVTW